MKRRTCAGLLLFLLLPACGKQPLPAPDAVARIDGSQLLYARFEEYLEQNIRESGGSLPSEVLSQLLDQFIDETLLSHLATDRQLVPADARARLAVAALLADPGGPSIEPSGTAIESYYRDHLDQFHRPEQVRLSQILVEDRASADQAARLLAEGVSFQEVAQRHAADATLPSNGDQGLLARGDLPTAFADTIFALKPGKVSEVIPAEYGFHIFLVEERLEASALPLAQAEPEIRAQLRRERTEQRLTELVGEARDLYEPEIFAGNLPFNYQGRYTDVS
jgi:hypothetical protein